MYYIVEIPQKRVVEIEENSATIQIPEGIMIIHFTGDHYEHSEPGAELLSKDGSRIAIRMKDWLYEFIQNELSAIRGMSVKCFQKNGRHLSKRSFSKN